MSIVEVSLTQTADHQRNEVPCSLPDDLEDVEDRCQREEYDEDDSSDLRRVVTVRDPGVRIVKRWARLVFGHDDGR